MHDAVVPVAPSASVRLSLGRRDGVFGTDRDHIGDAEGFFGSSKGRFAACDTNLRGESSAGKEPAPFSKTTP